MINVAFLSVPVRWLAALFDTKTNDLYTYTTAKGVEYYLHCRLMGKSNTITYHFSQSSENALPCLPKGYEIKTFANGVPYLSKVKDNGQCIHY